MSNTVLALKFVIGLRDRDDGLVVILCVGLEVNIAITADMCPVFGTIFVRVVRCQIAVRYAAPQATFVKVDFQCYLGWFWGRKSKKMMGFKIFYPEPRFRTL